VTHGIRLSGMPAFSSALSDTERWQVTALVAHADKLPPDVSAILTAKHRRPSDMHARMRV